MDILTYALSKKYTDEAIASSGGGGGTYTAGTGINISNSNVISNTQAYTELTATLVAGSTSLTLTDSSITTDSLYDIYTSVYRVNPTDVTVATGSITLTFAAQQSDLGVKVRVS